uniref:Probable imidazolonepropionase n=1 Tax=Sexangularia sp. CB-2014 TaxID=1486929 RepID=A0A7S1VKP5_9EUKA|mmetsp:Transcript_5472/g.17707  ORF Transcript_5472/g.17707 Transcript_5472/m.17707 type:complete len:462 (+) Transcript_5472:67-1452(+)
MCDFSCKHDFSLIIQNISTIVTPKTGTTSVHVLGRGTPSKNPPFPDVFDKSVGMEIRVGMDGLLAYVGPTDGNDAREGRKRTRPSHSACRIVDANFSACALPGFVDAHTHAIFVGNRLPEWRLKLGGTTYADIHAAGGGIHATVRATRDARFDELMDATRPRLQRAMRLGTTTMEIKSGYGLEYETELRQLKVATALNKELPLDLSVTYCGAHSVPKGQTADEATEQLVTKDIPALAAAMAAGTVDCDAIDVFVETNVFPADNARRILDAGRTIAGLRGNFHGDELTHTRSGPLAQATQSRAVSHLELADDDDIACLRAAGTVAVLLPTTAHILRLTPPPARAMIEAGVPVALGSDFNPNAPHLSMPFVMHLACLDFRMTPDEALIAATLNAAASVGREERVGSLEVGKQGDIVLLGAPFWEHVIYEFSSPPIWMVVKAGRVIHENDDFAPTPAAAVEAKD